MNSLKASISFKNHKNFDSLGSSAADALVIGITSSKGRLTCGPKFKGSKSAKALLDSLEKHKGFKAKHSKSVSFFRHAVMTEPFSSFEHMLAVGIGGSEDYHSQNLLKIGGKISKWMSARKLNSVCLALDSFLNPASSQKGKGAPKDFAGRPFLQTIPNIEQCFEKLALGIVLGLYRFRNYKSDKIKSSEIPEITFVSQILDQRKGNAIAKRVESIAQGVYLTRDLQTTPSIDLTPELLAKAAQDCARGNKIKVSVFDEKKLASKGMNGVLSVGKGSSNPPRLITMDYNPSKKKLKPVILVGKGITFDTGGTSLKPAPGMEEMKMDMSGSAAVIGAVYSLAKLGVKRRVIGIVAAAENRVSSTSINPGDIYTAYNGKTVEVLNTDAEGRLVLGDALSYAAEFSPECVVDVATLTGGVVVALGHECSGVMGNNEKAINAFRKASDVAGEKTWELPLFEEYAKDMLSPIADLKNIGSSRAASAPKAGCFLNYFVDKKYPWVHVDVAGTADTPSAQGPYCPESVGTAVPHRALVEFVENYDRYIK